MNANDVYEAYRFDEPWNGPNNSKLSSEFSKQFRRPEDNRPGKSTTSFVAVVGPETPFPGASSVRREDVSDGTETIMFVEINDSNINWLEPRDLQFDRMSFQVNDPKGTGLGTPYRTGPRVALLNGAVINVRSESPQNLRAMITANGGETVSIK